MRCRLPGTVPGALNKDLVVAVTITIQTSASPWVESGRWVPRQAGLANTEACGNGS